MSNDTDSVTILTHREICQRLEREIQLDGTLTQAAKVFGVSPATLSLILRSKRGVGPKILRKLGLRKRVQKVVTYEVLPKRHRSKALRALPER